MPLEPNAHVLAALVLLSRVGDVVSTRLVTPNLALEANEAVRSAGWKFAYATLLLALVPYYDARLGIVVFTLSMLVTSSNLMRGWVSRAIGDRAAYDNLLVAASRSRRRSAIGFVLSGALALIILGTATMLFSDPTAGWGYWVGVGVALCGLAYAVHGTSFIVRVFRDVKRA